MPTITKLTTTNKADEKGKNLHREQRQKIYATKRWRDMENAKLIQNPVCEICGEKLAVDVHHVRSFMAVEDETERLFLAFNFENLQSLCKECHAKIHTTRKNIF